VLAGCPSPARSGGTFDHSSSSEATGGPLAADRPVRQAWAFHACEDGAWWRLRYFTLGEASGARVGFPAQSPAGPGCTPVSGGIACQPGGPAGLRDGS
jgi:hypothetical protein